MTGEHKVFIGIGLATLVIVVSGIFLASKQDERLNKPLIGQEVAIEGRSHFPQGTEIKYNSNPPAGGSHYPDPAHAGIYMTPPPDGNLVHSLEHGAVILWYNANQLSKDQIEGLKNIYNQVSGKTIMTQRDSLDTPVALSSWGRVLKLQTIDETQIKDFLNTNIDRGPEQAPI